MIQGLRLGRGESNPFPSKELRQEQDGSTSRISFAIQCRQTGNGNRQDGRKLRIATQCYRTIQDVSLQTFKIGLDKFRRNGSTTTTTRRLVGC